MAITMNDNGRFLVDADATPARLANLIRNNPNRAAEIEAALTTRLTAQQGEKTTATTALQAQIAEKQALIDAMGGTVEGLRLARLARRQAALDAQVVAEAEAARQAAEIAAIDAEV